MSGDLTKLQRAVENGQHFGSPVQVFCIEMSNAVAKRIRTVSWANSCAVSRRESGAATDNG